jgi:hypothetical protein
MNNDVKKERFGYLAYSEHIRTAKIDGGAKALLWFYGFTFNWKNKKASHYAERTICSLVGMSLGTYQKRRKYLEDLGWIVVHHRGKNQQALVVPVVGRDDPDYENRCWAEWHPSNRSLEPQVVWDDRTKQFINLDSGEVLTETFDHDLEEILNKGNSSSSVEW